MPQHLFLFYLDYHQNGTTYAGRNDPYIFRQWLFIGGATALGNHAPFSAYTNGVFMSIYPFEFVNAQGNWFLSLDDGSFYWNNHVGAYGYGHNRIFYPYSSVNIST